MFQFTFWLSLFLFFSVIGISVFHRIYADRLKVEERVSKLINSREQVNHPDEHEEPRAFLTSLLKSLVMKMKNYLLSVTPKNKLMDIEKKLRDAGNPFGMNGIDFKVVQFSLTAFLFGFSSLIFMTKADDTFKAFILSIVFAGFGYGYCNFYLSSKTKNKIKEIEKAMPDFFDLVNVSIEAGMGLEGAIKKVCQQTDNALSKEFVYTLEDMKLGKSRRQAFIELRNRIPSDFFRSVMNSIIQADQMGIGISKALRTQSQRIREKQRQSAKEQAMKAPVKMLIPMIIFIFPTLFIVLIGPVIVKLVTEWM